MQNIFFFWIFFKDDFFLKKLPEPDKYDQEGKHSSRTVSLLQNPLRITVPFKLLKIQEIEFKH